MKLAKQLLAASFALAVAGGAADAQTTVQWNTTGAFSGCTTANATATFADCTIGTTTLRYDFNADESVVIMPPLFPTASGNFGSFVMSGNPLSGQDFAGVTFSMYINQIMPTTGSQTVSGAISGAVIAQGGQLLWGPIVPPAFAIDGVGYTLDVDAVSQQIRINPPGAGGSSGTIQTVRGTITMVPEPASFALVSAGLAGLAMVARRRRSA